jgi:hypothetical protein
LPPAAVSAPANAGKIATAAAPLKKSLRVQIPFVMSFNLFSRFLRPGAQSIAALAMGGKEPASQHAFSNR